MITTLRQPNLEKNSICLHPEILDVLFENNKQIKDIFWDLQGLCEISHLGLTIINPSHEALTFSSTPNIEYNLIKQELWANDPCFSLSINKEDIIWWDEHISEKNAKKIEKIKFINNQFKLGLTIHRKINRFIFLYSFATTSKQSNLKDYYRENILELISIGDYFYNRGVKNIYARYTNLLYSCPDIHSAFILPKLCRPSYLRLVSNLTD